MPMKVKEVAEIAGISVRTLHHYDEIGLLHPSSVTDAGYRLYSNADLEKLQQILFFKALGFPLKKIKAIIGNPSFDRLETLVLHKKMLMEKRRRIDEMIATVDKTLAHSKGEIQMSDREKFEGFDFSRNPYEKEAREHWGDEAVDHANEKVGRLTEGEKQALGDQFNAIYKKLARVRHTAPDSPEAQAAIGEWYDYLNSSFGYHYSPEAFKGLGQMYVDDPRFTKNIDKFGDGLAFFMRDAMAVYAERLAK